MYIINRMPQSVPQHLLNQLAEVETATIGHFRLMGFSDPAINPLKTGNRVSGTAVTLVLPGHDSTLLHHIVAQLREGDILIINRCGDQKTSCFGGGVAYAVKQKGVAAVVVDGPCNDPHEILELDLPVWSRGISPITTRLLNTGGAFNVPISCGGAVVNPGDAVLADDNGVLVLPKEEIQVTVKKAKNLEQLEKKGLPLIGKEMELGELSGATNAVLASLAEQQKKATI